MIPEFKILRRKCRRLKVKIPDEPYFAQADEYAQLQKTFDCETLLAKLLLAVDMILYPVYIIIRLIMQDFSPMYVFALSKTYSLWMDWFQFKLLSKKVESWRKVVRSVDGPWIATNDPDYHVFVYADGMERLKHAIALRPIRKTVKTSQVVQHPVQ